MKRFVGCFICLSILAVCCGQDVSKKETTAGSEGNIVGWFEIPVTDMDRAVKFYESVFNVKLRRGSYESFVLAWFPEIKGREGTAGALIKAPDLYQPRDNGVLVYFCAYSGDLANELKRARALGGKVLLPKTYDRAAHIYVAFLLDSEGNRIALYSKN